MSKTPRFLLAKYVPDLKRMEPRNIGLFLWAKGKVRCKFLDAPDFVNDLSTYERWKEYWKYEIGGDAVTPATGSRVSISTPECMDALLTMQKGNYILVDAGELVQDVRVREVESALDFLFHELVGAPGQVSEVDRRESLSRACRCIVEDSGIRQREGFRPKFPVECAVYGVKKHLRFSYGIGNGHPQALFQRVSLDRDSSVHDAALKMHTLLERALLPEKRFAAFVQSSLAQESEEAAENLELLRRLCVPIDVERHDEAVEAVKEVAS